MVHPCILCRYHKCPFWEYVCFLPCIIIITSTCDPMAWLEYSGITATSQKYLDTGYWYILVSKSSISSYMCHISKAASDWSPSLDNSAREYVGTGTNGNTTPGFSWFLHAASYENLWYYSTTSTRTCSRSRLLLALSNCYRLSAIKLPSFFCHIVSLLLWYIFLSLVLPIVWGLLW